MAETLRDQATRLAREAMGYLDKSNANIPNTTWRNGRLTEIAVWFARNAPGNTAVTSASGFALLPLWYFTYEPWLYGSGQPFQTPEGATDYLLYAREIANWGDTAQQSYYHTGRWYLLDVMSRLPKSELWGWGGYAPLFALPKIVAADPNLETRIKALDVLSTADLPVNIYDPILVALDQLRDNLGAVAGSQVMKQAAVAKMTTLRSRVEQQKFAAQLAVQQTGIVAQANAANRVSTTSGSAAIQAAQAAAAGITTAQTLPPAFDWKPWGTLGAVLGLVSGALWLKRRRAA